MRKRCGGGTRVLDEPKDLTKNTFCLMQNNSFFHKVTRKKENGKSSFTMFLTLKNQNLMRELLLVNYTHCQNLGF